MSLKPIWRSGTSGCNCDILALHHKTLRSNDAIWRHTSGSTLAQAMAWSCQATSHCLSQCWLVISEVLWYSHESNFTASPHGPMSLKIILYNYCHISQGPISFTMPGLLGTSREIHIRFTLYRASFWFGSNRFYIYLSGRQCHWNKRGWYGYMHLNPQTTVNLTTTNKAKQNQMHGLCTYCYYN